MQVLKNEEKRGGRSPVHILSGFVTVVLDLLWGIPEIVASLSVIGLPLMILLMVGAFAMNLIAVTLIQHYVDNDEWGSALAKGFALGIAAGVPYPVIGSVAGISLSIWSGIDYLHDRNQQP